MPDRILIFGNSGAGKSALAQGLAGSLELAHLDLDTLAWETAAPSARRALTTARVDLENFTAANEGWVIEGAYADLLALLLDECSELIFLNPGVEVCIRNCRARPWEPHEYPDKNTQDHNLALLLDWVRDYETRDDVYSLSGHRWLFDWFSGVKREFTA